MSFTWDVQQVGDRVYLAYLHGTSNFAAVYIYVHAKNGIVSQFRFDEQTQICLFNGMTIEEFWQGIETAPGLDDKIKKFFLANKKRFWCMPANRSSDNEVVYKFGETHEEALES